MHILRLASAFNSLTPADLVAVGLGQRYVDVDEVELQRGVTARGRHRASRAREVAVQVRSGRRHPGAKSSVSS
ncbi:hypothetical protein [Streptomyces sp. NPDC048438]|uniref:hypothetical protein n=1 Tax=Streptomyces sp. NPDC048438 TaxID=3365551 RepID=UPI003723EA3C